MRVPENLIHGRFLYGLYDILIFASEYQEDFRLGQYSLLYQQYLDLIQNTTLQYDQKSGDSHGKQHYETWNRSCIYEAECEVEDGDVDKKPVERNKEYILQLLDSGLVDPHPIESGKCREHDIHERTDQSKPEEVGRVYRLYGQMHIGDEIGDKTDISSQEKGKEYDKPLDGDFDYSEKQFMAFHKEWDSWCTS